MECAVFLWKMINFAVFLHYNIYKGMKRKELLYDILITLANAICAIVSVRCALIILMHCKL